MSSDINMTKEKLTYMHTLFKALRVYFHQFLLITSALVISSGHFSYGQDAAAGEKLFKINCAACHKETDAKLVGPGLKDVAKKVPQPAEEWLIKWIKNSQAVIKSGDAYANKIYEEYNKMIMPATALTDDEIKSILAYLDNPGGSKAAGATAGGAGAPSEEVLAGEKLFKINCAACHKTTDAKLVGPGLKDIASKVPQPAEEWLIKWIKNSQSLIKSGDTYANKIYEEYNKMVMPAQALSDAEIKSILAYIANPPAENAGQGTATASTEKAAPLKKESSSQVWYFLVGLIVLFLILISVLGGVKKSLQKMVNQKNGVPEPEPVVYNTAYFLKCARNNKKLIAIILIVVVSVASRAAWNGMMGIGVYQGYAPEQPIFFSHKIHAGENGINCVYCHSGVEKSKTSNVPSANVCMNCHKGIQEGAVTGKKEIAKIYEALDYDPDKGTYGPNPKPIKWVKVHQLPEHAYFNHAQHVTVGKQECTTCHGPVAEMDTLRQFSPLTMGWCVDCHRKTEVKMEGNPYYTKLHEELKKTYGNKPITVEMMGGIECGKCHY